MRPRDKVFYEIISTCSCWDDFEKKLSTKERKEKGDLFEDLVKYYLKTESYYSTILVNVWHDDEVPIKVAEQINLPAVDKGIDLVAETRDGKYWAIQCKYRTNTSQQIPHGELSTFSSLSFQVCKNISFALVCSTTERVTELYKKEEKISFCTLDTWSQISADLFKQISEFVNKGEAPKQTESQPRFHQIEAVDAAENHFIKNNNSRGKLIMPCGTGKSLAAYFIARKLNAKHIIIAVPSLSLVKQVLATWAKESVARNECLDWACVCSDETVASEEILSSRQELGVPCFTDEINIKKWLLEPSRGVKLTLTTYQSSHRLSKAAKDANYKADLTIFDEAHKTVGEKDKSYAKLIHSDNLHSSFRVFMTATERYYAGKSDNILSMDDETKYGNTFYCMSFKRAIESRPPILSDYNILTIGVSREEIKKYIQKNEQIRAKNEVAEDWEIEAEMLAALIALHKAMNQFPIKHAVTFHASIKKAERFKQFNDTYSRLSNDREIQTFHVSGSTPTGTRAKIISEFSNSPRSIITNARCLTEGVDVPNIDCVLFADPKNSKVDIVQATGRALRVHPEKKLGYVVIPVLHDEGATAFELCDSHSFSQIISTLRALASSDDRITDEFYDAYISNDGFGKRVKFILEQINPITEIQLKEFENEIKLRCWERLKHISGRVRKVYRNYDKAVEFVHTLGIRTKSEWKIYAMGLRKDLPELPSDISKVPWDDYSRSGWQNIDKWLGLSKQMLSYDEAQTFVAKLKLRNIKQWKNYVAGKYFGKLPKLPNNIPDNPDWYYKKFQNKWKGFAHWLGVAENEKQISASPMDFNDAREFVRSLNLKRESEWHRYKNGHIPELPLMPENLPSNPEIIYKNKGWVSFTDWVKRPRGLANSDSKSMTKPELEYKFDKSDEKKSDETLDEDLDENGNLNYEATARIIKTYNFKNKVEYMMYARKHILSFPFTKIPWEPDIYYKHKGWVSWKKWLSS